MQKVTFRMQKVTETFPKPYKHKGFETLKTVIKCKKKIKVK